ncbi:trimeric intracellular cation channel family protein [Xanthomonadaceae bacterium JHOS43]|nr:trimeric intracellular cation channel family protein [Xanthomonadaceae bacterium JHOS43]
MSSWFVTLLDFIGTFAFAISGALLAVRRNLDLFGVLVLSFAAASSGGIVRDLLLAATPPVALADWRYLAVAVVAGIITFHRADRVEKLRNPVQFFDAVGLGLFAVLGAGKALAYGLGPVPAVMLGVLSGIGGGIARDVLVAQVPNVLKHELYAVAALVGASIVVAGHMFDWPAAPTTAAGAIACIGLRILAIRRGWRLPVASTGDSPRK